MDDKKDLVDERVIRALAARIALIAAGKSATKTTTKKGKEERAAASPREMLAASKELRALMAMLGGRQSTGADPWIVATRAEVAEFFGRSPNTIKDWIKKGMPGVAGRGKTPGRYDLREIQRWKEANIGSSGRNDNGDESRGEAERRGAWADARHREVKLQERIGQLVEWERVVRIFARFGTHAMALLGQVPTRLIGFLPAETPAEDRRRFLEQAKKAITDVQDVLEDGLRSQLEDEYDPTSEDDAVARTSDRADDRGDVPGDSPQGDAQPGAVVRRGDPPAGHSGPEPTL